MDSVDAVSETDFEAEQRPQTIGVVSERCLTVSERDRSVVSQKSPVRKPPYLYRPFSGFTDSTPSAETKDQALYGSASDNMEETGVQGAVASPVDGYLVEESPGQDASLSSVAAVYVMDTAATNRVIETTDETAPNHQNLSSGESNHTLQDGEHEELYTASSSRATEAIVLEKTVHGTAEHGESFIIDSNVSIIIEANDDGKPMTNAFDTAETVQSQVMEIEDRSACESTDQPDVYTEGPNDVAETSEIHDGQSPNDMPKIHVVEFHATTEQPSPDNNTEAPRAGEPLQEPCWISEDLRQTSTEEGVINITGSPPASEEDTAERDENHHIDVTGDAEHMEPVVLAEQAQQEDSDMEITQEPVEPDPEVSAQNAAEEMDDDVPEADTSTEHSNDVQASCHQVSEDDAIEASNSSDAPPSGPVTEQDDIVQSREDSSEVEHIEACTDDISRQEGTFEEPQIAANKTDGVDIQDELTDPQMNQDNGDDSQTVAAVKEQVVHELSDNPDQGGSATNDDVVESDTQDSVPDMPSVQEDPGNLQAERQAANNDQETTGCQVDVGGTSDVVAAALLTSDDGVTEDESITSTIISVDQSKAEQTVAMDTADSDEEIRWIAASVMTDSDQTSDGPVQATLDVNAHDVDEASKTGLMKDTEPPASPAKLGEAIIKVEKLPLRESRLKIVGSAVMVEASAKGDTRTVKDSKGSSEKRTRADPRKCELCEKKFASVSGKNRHVRNVHNCLEEIKDQKQPLQYPCPKCDQSFNSKREKLHHLRIAHEMVVESALESTTSSKEAHTCTQCNTTYASIGNKVRHMKIAHSTSTGKSLLAVSKQIIMKSKLHQTQTKKPKETTATSDKKEKSNAKPDHMCFCCNKCFDIFQNLKRHIRRCHSENANVQSGNTHQCTQCGKFLASVSSLAKHVKHTCCNSRHSSPPEKHQQSPQKSMHVCSECGKKFKSEFNLKSHKEISHPTLDHTCKDCGKTYANKHSLIKHLRTAHKGIGKESRSPQSASRVSTSSRQSPRQTPPTQASQRSKTPKQQNTNVPTPSRPHPGSTRLSRRSVGFAELSRSTRGGKLLKEGSEDLQELKFESRKRTRSEPSVPLTKLKVRRTDGSPEKKTFDESKMSQEERNKLNTCFKCGNTFSTFRNLHRHVTSVHKIKSFPKTPEAQVKQEKLANESIKKNSESPPPAPSVAKKPKQEDKNGEENVFRCPECRLYYYKQCQLDEHYRRAHGDENMPEQCVLCEKGFFTKESLVHHLKQFHGADRKQKASSDTGNKQNEPSHSQETDNSYMCPECDTPYFSETEFEEHVLKDHGWGSFPYLCPKCSQRFLFPGKLEDHLQSHYSMQKVECPAPEKVIPDLKTDSPSKTEDDSGTKCTYCEKVYQFPYSCERHIIKEHGKTKLPFPCSKCVKGFCTKSRLESHNASFHHLPAETAVPEADQKPIESVVSKALKSPKYSQKTDDATPQKSANQQSPKSASKASCHLCFRVYKDAKQLEDHIRTAHGNDNLPLHCPMCSRGYMVATRLENHCIRSHSSTLAECEAKTAGKSNSKASEEKDQQKEPNSKAGSAPKNSCSLCSKSYAETRHLEQHFRNVHGTEKMPHQCPVCDLSYLVLPSLESHCLRTHKSPLSACKWQNKTQRSRGNHDKSVDIETTEAATEIESPTSTSCFVCGKSFAKFSKMERHIRQVHGEERLPHHCPSCQKGYMTWSSVIRHSQRDHGISIKDAEEKMDSEPVTPVESRSRRKIVAPKRHLSPMDTARHRCEACDNAFESSQGLLNHIRATHGHDHLPYQCSVCRKGFLSEQSLLMHGRTHEKSVQESIYCCSICQASTASLEALEQHTIWQHGDENCPLQCPKCGRGFITASNMQCHLSNQECEAVSSDGGHSDIEMCDVQNESTDDIHIETSRVQIPSLLSGQSSFYMECDESDTDGEPQSAAKSKGTTGKKTRKPKQKLPGSGKKKITPNSSQVDTPYGKKFLSPKEMNDLVLKQLPPLDSMQQQQQQPTSSNLLNQLILACDTVAE